MLQCGLQGIDKECTRVYGTRVKFSDNSALETNLKTIPLSSALLLDIYLEQTKSDNNVWNAFLNFIMTLEPPNKVDLLIAYNLREYDKTCQILVSVWEATNISRKSFLFVTRQQ